MEELSYDAIDTDQKYTHWKYPLTERFERHLEAVQNTHPWHMQRSPWGPPVAPPTVLGNAAMRFMEAMAGAVPPGTLHARQEIETQAALRRDRRLIGYGRFAEKYEKRGRRWFVWEARFRDETGLMIGHSRITMALPLNPAAPAPPEQGARSKEQKKAPDRTPGLTPITRTITQEQMTAYSEDSGNAQRGKSIHVQPEVAKAAGFEATVAQGLMTADYISEMMTNELGKEWFENAKLSLAFLRPVLCGETVTANGRLAEAHEEGAVVRRVYEVWCDNAAGEPVASGTATALVMPGR